MAPQSVARGAPQSGDRAAQGMQETAPGYVGAQTARYGVASSFGRDCSALRGLIRFVAFRASHPATHRRASVDLFSASLKCPRSCRPSCAAATPLEPWPIPCREVGENKRNCGEAGARRGRAGAWAMDGRLGDESIGKTPAALRL
jgi:hypothetical protein